jgi:hypothetical protein
MNVNNNKINEFQKSVSKYISYIATISELYEYNLIIYDEVENFKDYNSPLFNYPFQLNKNVLGTLDLYPNISESNYNYTHTDIYLQIS